MEKVRSFIAIELPSRFKLELSKLQARLKADNQPRIKWVAPDGMHLTLKFLGSVAQDSIEAITRAMAEATQGISPFNLDVQQLGAFPNLKRVQVVWIGFGGEIDKLGQLHQLLETSLAHLGFAPELRPFKPHLTLARLGNEASAEERQRFGELIAGTKFELNYSIKVDALSLIRSQLTSTGAIYSRISSAGLSKETLS